jgi:hypothetical protein
MGDLTSRSGSWVGVGVESGSRMPWNMDLILFSPLPWRFGGEGQAGMPVSRGQVSFNLEVFS